jgi:hypothetical protein
MSAQGCAVNAKINSCNVIQDTVVHVPVLPPILDYQSWRELVQNGQIFDIFDELLNHVKKIDFSEGYSLLYDTH